MDCNKDDGTLSFLNIGHDPENKIFHCDVVRQSDLIGKSFWVLDWTENAKTRYGERMCILIGYTKDCPQSEQKKFMSSSKELRFQLRKIEELKAFPRYVTMCQYRNAHYFE